MLRAVVFDIDNTLYDYDAAHAGAYRVLSDYACGQFGLRAEEFDALYRRANRRLAEHTGGGCAAAHNRLIRCQLLLEEIGQPLGFAPRLANLYWSELIFRMRPLPGAGECLSWARARGLKVGIGTNMTADRQFEKLERLGFMQYVDFLVSSEEASAEKPDRRLFDLCAQKAGFPARDCAFVGDDLEKDALGAARAGLTGIWLCRRSDSAPVPPGVLCVRDLSELPELLESL